MNRNKNSSPHQKPERKLSSDTRLELIKLLYYYEHKSMLEIATELKVDKSTICRDMKKIKEDFVLRKLNLDEMAAIIRFRADKRQKELLKIYEKYPNPYVRISCLRHMREEDKNLIDLLRSIGDLRKNPVNAERVQYTIVYEAKNPNRRLEPKEEKN